MKSILSNIFVIVFLLGLVLVATIYTDSIKKIAFDVLHIKSDKVLGMKVFGDTIDPEKKQQEVSEMVKGVVNQQVELAKQQLLNIKIGDILTTLQQSKKIVHDVGVAGEFVQQQIKSVQEKLPHNSQKK